LKKGAGRFSRKRKTSQLVCKPRCARSHKKNAKKKRELSSKTLEKFRREWKGTWVTRHPKHRQCEKAERGIHKKDIRVWIGKFDSSSEPAERRSAGRLDEQGSEEEKTSQSLKRQNAPPAKKTELEEAPKGPTAKR